MNPYVAERKHNPFINSPSGGATLSALQEPFFRLMPPSGFGVLEMTDGECLLWRKGRPTRTKITELHRDWFEHGTPLVIELAVA